jgi:hypothetical protein
MGRPVAGQKNRLDDRIDVYVIVNLSKAQPGRAATK